MFYTTMRYHSDYVLLEVVEQNYVTLITMLAISRTPIIFLKNAENQRLVITGLRRSRFYGPNRFGRDPGQAPRPGWAKYVAWDGGTLGALQG